jgi:hypothetical protein
MRDEARRDRLGDGLDPGLPDLVERLAEAEAVDVAVRRQAGNQHGYVEATALGIRRLGKEEGLAFRLGNTAAILPAHQGVHFGVFVDRLVDDDEQPRARKREHVLVQVGIVARMLGRPVAVAFERAQCAPRSSLVHRRLRKMRITLEQSLDRSRHGDGLRVAVDVSGHLQAERQAVVLQHGKRHRGNAEQ